MAVVSEPLGISQQSMSSLDSADPHFEQHFSDLYLQKLNSECDHKNFFNVAKSSESTQQRQTQSRQVSLGALLNHNSIRTNLDVNKLQRNLQLFSVEQELNQSSYQSPNFDPLSPQNSFSERGLEHISMPSGEIFEALSSEYQFHLDNIQMQRYLADPHLGMKESKRCQEDTLCRYNSRVALQLQMTEVAITWQQLGDIAHQL